MTYKKIAQIAGVSPSTVSKVMSGSPEVSQKTADRIRELMKEYGCSPARYFRSASSDLKKIRIAVLVPEIISVFYAIQVTEFVHYLDSINIHCNIYLTGFESKKALTLISQLAEEGLTDGIIYLVGYPPFSSSDLPLVKISSSESEPGDCVGVNLRQGIMSAFLHLRELGHTQIGFIGETNTAVKQEFFYTVAKELGFSIDEHNVFTSIKRFEHIGIEAAEHFLKDGFSATAFITAYDEVALGAMQTFRQGGYRIPEDISFIGMNDIPYSEYANTPLTTLQMFNEEVCHLAVNLLLDKILHPEKHIIQNIKVQSKLIVRGTTGIAPKTHHQ